jgi:hypothetical protein
MIAVALRVDCKAAIPNIDNRAWPPLLTNLEPHVVALIVGALGAFLSVKGYVQRT